MTITNTATATSRVLITGRTYPVRHQLRDLGGEWDPVAQGWRVPDHVAAAAHDLVLNPPRPAAQAARYGRRPHRPARRGKCEDAPCCGCCG